MGNDSPDWSSLKAAGQLGDMLFQYGKLMVRTDTRTLAAGANYTIGWLNSSPDFVSRVCGIRFLCMDDIKFRVYLYNTFYGMGYYIVDHSYEIWYPPSINWLLSQGDYATANFINTDSAGHIFRIYITCMDYPRPVGWIPKPMSYFTVDDSTPAVGQSVAFTDESKYEPTSWVWVFGDGSTSTLRNPTHVYSVAGTYYASLVASNAGGDDISTITIIVS